MMKGSIACMALVLGAAMGVTSCSPSLPPVPESNRRVVPPSGSTNVEKAWNPITKGEGDAILGPLSNARR